MKKINPCGKMRPLDHPYEIYIAPLRDGGQIEWRVLKKYKVPEQEAKDEFARWFTAGRSPMSFDTWEYGDMYVPEVKQARRVTCEKCEFAYASREVEGRYYCDDCYEDMNEKI